MMSCLSGWLFSDFCLQLSFHRVCVGFSCVCRACVSGQVWWSLMWMNWTKVTKRIRDHLFFHAGVFGVTVLVWSSEPSPSGLLGDLCWQQWLNDLTLPVLWVLNTDYCAFGAACGRWSVLLAAVPKPDCDVPREEPSGAGVDVLQYLGGQFEVSEVEPGEPSSPWSWCGKTTRGAVQGT